MQYVVKEDDFCIRATVWFICCYSGIPLSHTDMTMCLMVGVHLHGILAPHFCQVGSTVGCMQSKRAAAIASYHRTGYCARQSIIWSIYMVAADTV